MPRRVRGSNFLIRVICCEKPEYKKIGLCSAVFGAVPRAAHADGPDSANWQHAAPDAYSGVLCGLVCGWQYGAAVGFVAPLLRSVLFGMPPMYPVAIAMAFELLTYGLVIGLVYRRMAQKGAAGVYAALLTAMAAGRLVWGVAEVVLLGLGGKAFTAQAFLAGALLNAVPGIIVQLVLIPAVMAALQKAGAVKEYAE